MCVCVQCLQSNLPLIWARPISGQCGGHVTEFNCVSSQHVHCAVGECVCVCLRSAANIEVTGRTQPLTIVWTRDCYPQAKQASWHERIRAWALVYHSEIAHSITMAACTIASLWCTPWWWCEDWRMLLCIREHYIFAIFDRIVRHVQRATAITDNSAFATQQLCRTYPHDTSWRHKNLPLM